MHMCASICFQLFLLLALRALKVNWAITISFSLPQTLFGLQHYLDCKDRKEMFKQSLILELKKKIPHVFTLLTIRNIPITSAFLIHKHPSKE